jgi:lysine-specific demethylase/histidyl-hydroxylase NO66
VFEPAEPGAPAKATGAKLIDAELTPGDALYIPRQFPHAARTATSASAHLTVGVLTVKWVELLREAVGQAIADLVKERLTELKDRLDGVETAALAERAALRFWSGRGPVLTGQLEQLLHLDALDDRSVLRRRPGMVCRLEQHGDRLRLLLGDRELDLPAFAEPALALILERDRFSVADLVEHLDERSRLVLVRRLVREGLLEAADA